MTLVGLCKRPYDDAILCTLSKMSAGRAHQGEVEADDLLEERSVTWMKEVVVVSSGQV